MRATSSAVNTRRKCCPTAAISTTCKAFCLAPSSKPCPRGKQRSRLVVESVDRVRSIDSRTPLVVSFNQPWAEYIARKDQELTPWHFADTLVRGELGLAGVGLEIHYGYWPGGTLPRDPQEVSRLLDRWSQIGVPLMVILAAPSSMGADPL